jgi:hypothetical protein
MSASLAVQRLLAAALAGVPGVTGVFDGPPVDAAPPYLVIGGDVMTDWSTKTETGREHLLRVSVWDAGPGLARVKPLMAAVDAAVSALSGSSGGQRVVSARFVRALVLGEPDGWTQGLMEFRVRSLADEA